MGGHLPTVPHTAPPGVESTAPVPGAFELQCVFHLIRPVGVRASDLEDLRAQIATVEPAALFQHTVQCTLRRPESDEPPADDISSWVRGVVLDSETAERLSFAVQMRGGSPAELRAALLEVLEAIPEKDRRTRDAPAESSFAFLTAESVPVPTGWVARDPQELLEALEATDLSAWFFHLFEQPWFEAGRPAIVRWLAAHGEARFADALEEEARSGRALGELRRRVLRRWRQSRLRSRVAAASGETDSERRESARAAVAGLVRRMRGEGRDDTRRGS